MSLTNAAVHERFAAGKAGRSSNGNLRSERHHSDKATALVSYTTVIAIRRDSDGVIFRNAHAYSVTTTQHQNHSYGTPAFSFTCVSELMGSEWWREARLVDQGPRSCNAEPCRTDRKAATDDYHAQWNAYRDGNAGNVEPTIQYPDYDACSHEGEDGHRLTITGYDSWYLPAVLLDWPGRDQVLLGFERGKAIRYQGRADQLWGAILPRWATDIVAAFDTLRPRDMEPDALRQGDLFFRPYHGKCHCVCHNADAPIWNGDAESVGQRYPRMANRESEAIEAKAAWAAITNKSGLRIKRHGCDPVGYMINNALAPDDPPDVRSQSFGANVCKRASMPPADAVPMRGLTLPGKGDRHVATDCYIRPDWSIWVRGWIEHPEHPRLHLPGWHTVERSMARKAVASAYRAGGRAYAD